jgi:hypothetical protein
VLNTWKVEDQTPAALCAGLALVGAPEWRVSPLLPRDCRRDIYCVVLSLKVVALKRTQIKEAFVLVNLKK